MGQVGVSFDLTFPDILNPPNELLDAAELVYTRSSTCVLRESNAGLVYEIRLIEAQGNTCEQSYSRRPLRRGSRMSRSQSPSRFAPSTTSMIATAGKFRCQARVM